MRRAGESRSTRQAATEMAASHCIENTNGHRGQAPQKECGWKYGDRARKTIMASNPSKANRKRQAERMTQEKRLRGRREARA